MIEDNYPPILTRPEAAALCRLSLSGFDAWVRKGIVPPAITGTRRWSRDAILKAVNGSGAIGVDVGLSPFELWKAENARKAEQPPTLPSTPLGKREVAGLAALLVGRTDVGPSTLGRLHARGYLLPTPGGGFELRLSKAGRLAAERHT